MSLRTCAVLVASATFFTACSGDDGPTGITEGMAVAKFCHQLRRQTATVDLTLEFGQPPITRMTTRTNFCTPVAGMPCTTVPVGLVPLRLLEGDVVLATRNVVLQNGGEYGFQAVVNSVGQVAIAGFSLNGGTCTMEFLPAPDGGFPDVGPAPDSGGGDAVADAVRAETAAGDVAAPADVGVVVDVAVVADAGAPVDAAVDAAAPDAAVTDVAVVVDAAVDDAAVATDASTD
jgi:hypothetical protein